MIHQSPPGICWETYLLSSEPRRCLGEAACYGEAAQRRQQRTNGGPDLTREELVIEITTTFVTVSIVRFQKKLKEIEKRY